MVKLKTIRNVSAKSQGIMFKGHHHTIKGYAEGAYDLAVANAFIDRHPGVVVDADDDFGGVAKPVKEEEKIWIANMTGNPDAPMKIKTKVWVNKQWQVVESANPLKRPWVLKEFAEGPMVEYTAKDGTLEALNMPGKWVTIPPYKRVEMDPGLARWFLGRSHMSTPKVVEGEQVSKVIVSRPRGTFEPDMSWPLDEIIGYMSLIDPDAKPGQSEEMTRRALAKKKKVTKDEIEYGIDEAKRLQLKRIHFRLVDPSYALPTRQEFNEFMRGPIEEVSMVEQLLGAEDEEMDLQSSDSE